MFQKFLVNLKYHYIEMAFDVYPGAEMATLDQKYTDLMPNADIAGIETMVAKVLPMNAVFVGKMTASLAANAQKPYWKKK
jgi:hypothetical protein